MKSEFSSGWIPKNSSSTPARHQPQLHQSNNSHQQLLPPSSPLLTPRAAAPTNKASSFAASVRSVFQRSPHRATSAASLRSAYSANSSAKPPSYTSQVDTSNLHPYAAMVAGPLPVVSSHDASDEEDECPVCLEPLSSSFRLPGEKPHIVPECGHALHEVSTAFCPPSRQTCVAYPFLYVVYYRSSSGCSLFSASSRCILDVPALHVARSHISCVLGRSRMGRRAPQAALPSFQTVH
ncbi:hypothetical protein BD311DRAFT_216881 [Dichomitus squalens]|uniref:Uncharacterized protein n=1 Tax=Dichomitus squalens TaxID=114155 RepID=A0A4Q9MSB5_9APHY|nr:hypothetical protein BD311DRAFT_216881 [Dichomitus squalens]